MAAVAACSSPATTASTIAACCCSDSLGRPGIIARRYWCATARLRRLWTRSRRHGVPADLAQAGWNVRFSSEYDAASSVGDGGAHVGDHAGAARRTRRAWRGAPHVPRSAASSAARASVISIASAHRDAPDRGAAVRLTHDEPLRLQLDERRPGHGATARVPIAELGLDQPFAGREHTSDDVVAEVVGDRFGPGDPQARRRGAVVDRAHRDRHRSDPAAAGVRGGRAPGSTAAPGRRWRSARGPRRSRRRTHGPAVRCRSSTRRRRTRRSVRRARSRGRRSSRRRCRCRRCSGTSCRTDRRC